ncbi:hypothetical protein EPUL_003518 [Erysiphe pulchra]|uniref:SAC3/GANP/THP3 conserved domain-containing protein n=1 Tax=Erysiphe pulchra TaxID=225359 RepID=A0A2S4PZ49_9PEZI|nr:hypothetical protein EPUL_003518 [Erysiphe pulchra]
MNSMWTNVITSVNTQETRVLAQTDRPSYHSVQVRQNLHSSFPQNQAVMPSPSPAPVSEPPQTRKKIDWPQPVRSYVQRSFDTSNLLEDVTRPEMEAKLKETITTATDQDRLDKIDWDNLPLPQQMIRYQRAQPGWQQSSLESRIDRGNANLVSNSKKRKSLDLGNNNDNNQLHNSANLNNAEKNIHSKINDDKGTSKLQKSLEKRQRRFEGAYKNNRTSPSPETTSGPVIGTCQALEKRYFRLTSAPNPSHSLRQDLTVQHIANEFTVSVYETHARIALEKGDLGEYNQCQTQLRILNAQNLGGNVVEFKAYRILYFIHTSNRTALNDILADLTTAEKEEPPIKHALCVRSALALGNYHRFFRLYQNTPNMGAYLMDMFVVRERLSALSNICKAYKPDVKLRFIVDELGFESDSDAAQFICDHNGQHLLEEKSGSLYVLTGKAGAIFEGAKVLAFRKIDIKGQI